MVPHSCLSPPFWGQKLLTWHVNFTGVAKCYNAKPLFRKCRFYPYLLPFKLMAIRIIVSFHLSSLSPSSTHLLLQISSSSIGTQPAKETGEKMTLQFWPWHGNLYFFMGYLISFGKLLVSIYRLDGGGKSFISICVFDSKEHTPRCYIFVL